MWLHLLDALIGPAWLTRHELSHLLTWRRHVSPYGPGDELGETLLREAVRHG